MQKLWLSFATGFLILGALSAPAEADFKISTGYNNHEAWGDIDDLDPFFVGGADGGYLRGPQGIFTNNGMGKINPIIALALGVSDPNAAILYKNDRGGSDFSVFPDSGITDSYDTTYSNNNNNATISYSQDATARIYTHVPTYLFLKDGDADPYWYLFDITNRWNGIDDLIMEDFFPTHSISHVTIYGGTLDAPPGGLTAVPEPASMAVWGSMLAVGAFVRRRRRVIA